ncbi:MAG: hypothetical protein NTY75_00245 [Candidatus Shapirobacteria bacterium]|nr:hypothetical protein [Candidatus Shapirobacteria bacterium]
MKKVYVVLIVLIALALVRLVFVSNSQNNTGNSAIVAPSGTPGSTLNCSMELSDSYSKNNTSIDKYLVKKSQLTWKGQTYNASIFNCPDEQQSYVKVYLLSKTINSGDKKILFTMEDETFNDSAIRDINADGLGELIVEHSNGGNCWLCSGSSIFSIIGDNVTDLLKDLPMPEGGKNSNVQIVGGIDKNGTEEIFYVDDSWELADGFFKSNAPRHQVLLTWDEGEYKIGGAYFSTYYLNQISKRNKEFEALTKSKTPDLHEAISLSIESYLDYQEIEQSDLGFDTFTRQIDNLPKTIKISEEDKVWIEEIKNRIEQEYKNSKPTPTIRMGFP